ncbi:DNA polymerase alpha subunit B [Mayamaea pseudoterrestris]|nr:DNA polymerase alpha subunit B [Mayamaea pseudoterrestris]
MTTSVSELQQEIKRALAGAGLSKIRPEIMSQCVALASAIAVTPERMAECWEAFSMNRNVKELNESSFKSYREQLIKDCDDTVLRKVTDVGAVMARPSLKNKADSLPAVTPPAKRLHQRSSTNNESNKTNSNQQLPSSFSAEKNRRISLSPGRPLPSASVTPSNSSYSYAQRQGSGDIVFSYQPESLASNGLVMNTTTDRRTTPKCLVQYQHFETNVQKPFRHFFTSMDDRAKALDQHLVHLGMEICERFGLGQESVDESNEETSTAIAGLEAVGIPRQVKVTNIGRICNAAHEGKLNETSILLEGSRDASGGSRIELDLSLLKERQESYSLFPGQIVAVEGMNTSGRKMVAERICEGAAHEPLKSSVKELMRFHHDDAYQGGAPLTIVAACGPFTTADNLDFAPLQDLMSNVVRERPDVVILTGPFVDLDNELIRSGQTTLQFQDGEEILVPYETFFAVKVAGILEEIFESEVDLQTQFVLVPSLEDATTDWVYPQAPFADRVKGGKLLKMSGAEDIDVGSLGLHRIDSAGNGAAKGSSRVHCVSNPCTLQINEVVIGVTSTDVLFHLSKEETGNVGGKLRLPRIAQHMLQQRSYYPLFPGSEFANNLDLKHMVQWSMPCQPDLLIVPSRLNKLAEPILGSTLVVNPGRITVGSAGGAYAIMQIQPMKRETLEEAGSDNVELAHNATQRTVVEIRKI